MSALLELPEGTAEWVESQSGTQVLEMKRHVARREAWVVDAKTADGQSKQFFLRIDRNALKGRGGPWSLARETQIIRSLAKTKVPVQGIYAWCDTRQLALQEMVAGIGELDSVEAEQQQVVFTKFMDALAQLHKLDPHSLAIDDVCSWPITADDHALGEVRTIQSLWQAMPIPNTVSRLYSAFGHRWLENHVPEKINHTVLVQGDTGPANFMFEGDELTAFVDWEWAHFGDPMEDLGNIVVRDFFYPSSGGNLAPLFAHYQQSSGIEVDNDKVKYYTVQQLLRSVMSLMYTVSTLKWHDEVAMNMGYEINCQRAMCDAIARAMDLSFAQTGMPPSVIESAKRANGGRSGAVFNAVIKQLQQQIVPAQQDSYIKHRAEHSTAMIEYLDRLDCYAEALDLYELNALNDLLGQKHNDLSQAEDALLERIESMHSSEDESEILAYLYTRAYRLEDLMEPLVRPFANRTLAEID